MLRRRGSLLIVIAFLAAVIASGGGGVTAPWLPRGSGVPDPVRVAVQLPTEVAGTAWSVHRIE